MRIRALFDVAKADNRALFIPYLTCGDPDLATTEALILQLNQIGADVIELGVPFSDPVADGKTNQLSSMRALKQGVSIEDCCRLVKKIRQQDCVIPIVLFTYFNPIVRFGEAKFAILAAECGVDAVLVVDLPIEEGDEFAALLKQYRLGHICFISPTTTTERIQQSNQIATEFLYYVSRTGVTGAQTALMPSLESELTKLKTQCSLPIAVGFGISTPHQASQVATFADGVIVGSALVSMLETDDITAGKERFLALATALRAAV